MSDKVQKIKEEIVRRRNSLPKETEHEGLKAVYGGIAHELTELLEFIDSLPEEPASEDLEEAARHYLLNTHTSPLNNILHRAALIIEMQYHEDIENAFKAGAEWQKKKSMQDLLEKAEDAISMISRHYVGEDYTFDQIWEQFKNYIQDEM